MTSGYQLFETAIGTCGIAWSEDGILAVQLPEERPSATANRLRTATNARKPTLPPESVQKTIRRIQLHIGGQAQDFTDVRLDMSGVPPLNRALFEAARHIRSSERKTYGEVADAVGKPGAARAVGYVLGKNPFAVIVPCHRVVAASGKLVGIKAKLLALEGSVPRNLRQDPNTLEGQLPFDGETAVAMIAETDAVMAELIERVGPLQLRRRPMPSTFDSLAQSIAYQQLTGKAAATIMARVRALFPDRQVLDPAEILATQDERFRSAGLSRSKTLAMKDLAAKTLDGTVPNPPELAKLSDDEIVTRLSAVRGIGRWTVEMLLIFRMGRPNILPVTDYGVRKGYAVAFRKRSLPSALELERRGRRWAPFRSVASWYLWRANELSPVEKN